MVARVLWEVGRVYQGKANKCWHDKTLIQSFEKFTKPWSKVYRPDRQQIERMIDWNNRIDGWMDRTSESMDGPIDRYNNGWTDRKIER